MMLIIVHVVRLKMVEQKETVGNLEIRIKAIEVLKDGICCSPKTVRD